MQTSGIYYVDADKIPKTSITNKCIVLDLDQTLIATQEKMDSLRRLNIMNDPNLLDLRQRTYHISIEDLESPGYGSKYDYWGVARPHYKDFLLFCFSYFKIVAVWSAGKQPYVEAIVDFLFKDLPQPHIIFSYNDCDFDKLKHPIKPLTKMFNSNKVLKEHMNLQNTFVLDDNSATFYMNTGNAILIPAYEPACTIPALSRDDPTLLQLKYWLGLKDVVSSTNVTSLDKRTIFEISVENYLTHSTYTNTFN